MKLRKVTSFISLMGAPVIPGTASSNTSASYIIGGIIALFILGYLIFTLLRPEKF